MGCCRCPLGVCLPSRSRLFRRELPPEWARLLNFLRLICRWKLIVCLDGKPNPHKQYEDQRRSNKVEATREADDLRGQVLNTPTYITWAAKVCKLFSNIEVQLPPTEADPQVVYHALSRSWIPVTGDGDLLAYGAPGSQEKKSLAYAKCAL